MCSEPTSAIHMCIVLKCTSLPPPLPLYLIFQYFPSAQFREAPRQMKDKVQQLRGEIDEKTSWDSKYCSDIFHRR